MDFDQFTIALLMLSERDPAVPAGKFAVVTLPWMVPAGAVSFAPDPSPTVAP